MNSIECQLQLALNDIDQFVLSCRFCSPWQACCHTYLSSPGPHPEPDLFLDDHPFPTVNTVQSLGFCLSSIAFGYDQKFICHYCSVVTAGGSNGSPTAGYWAPWQNQTGYARVPYQSSHELLSLESPPLVQRHSLTISYAIQISAQSCHLMTQCFVQWPLWCAWVPAKVSFNLWCVGDFMNTKVILPRCSRLPHEPEVADQWAWGVATTGHLTICI